MKHQTVITGAGSGLGQGLALCLARNGHTILATDLTLAAAQKTVDAIVAEGGTAEAFRVDVASEASVKEFAAEIDSRPITVLINNAGLQFVSPVEDFPTEKWDLLVDVILKGTFMMTRAVMPGMRARGFGRLIHIGSIHAVVASPFKSGYIAAKHAQLGFSKSIALETCDTDITSNLLNPSYLYTPLVEAQIEAQARTRGISPDEVIEQVMLKPMPKKCFITFEEVAAAVEFLASPMARNITGQAIAMDGGWTAQ